jgi:hypothetical protein
LGERNIQLKTWFQCLMTELSFEIRRSACMLVDAEGLPSFWLHRTPSPMDSRLRHMPTCRGDQLNKLILPPIFFNGLELSIKLYNLVNCSSTKSKTIWKIRQCN